MTVESILQAMKIAQQQSAGTSITTETLESYDLGGVDCKKCNNTGALLTLKDDGTLYARECDCMAKRRALRRIRRSGLADAMRRYTFQNYETPDETRQKIKAKAVAFCDSSQGWFYIAGRSGSGKSHICTAICSTLMEHGYDVYYMSWRDESTALKALVTDAEAYEEKIAKLKSVAVLYIDDFLKGGDTDADIRLAFEILNARYIDARLRTVLSSEKDITQIMDRDEALGGRIYERSKGFCLVAPKENWRLR